MDGRIDFESVFNAAEICSEHEFDGAFGGACDFSGLPA
jgi:hypothetical protein